MIWTNNYTFRATALYRERSRYMIRTFEPHQEESFAFFNPSYFTQLSLDSYSVDEI